MLAEPGQSVRLAMWSGPRNISTALMRSFGNRPDCCVVDEPFYGYYLQQSGSDHPGREQIIAAMDCDWRSIAAGLASGACPFTLFYQKLMTHHMLAEVDLAFTEQLCNCFLVREPARMILSYSRVRPEFTLEDLGLPQQLAIYRYLRNRTGTPPLVLDAADVLADPRTSLARLCAHAGVEFSEAMLHWPPGPRASDGVWAPYWYASVEASTGFEAPPTGVVDLPARFSAMHEQALAIYRELTAEPGGSDS